MEKTDADATHDDDLDDLAERWLAALLSVGERAASSDDHEHAEGK